MNLRGGAVVMLASLSQSRTWSNDDISSRMLCFPDNICSTNFEVLKDVSTHPSVLQYKILKGLQSDKLSGDAQIFQIWPYLNSLIIIKLPFSQKNISKFSHFPLPSKTCALPFDSALETDPKNIFYYQRNVENYTDQVLNFLLFDRHEYIHTGSSGL